LKARRIFLCVLSYSRCCHSKRALFFLTIGHSLTKYKRHLGYKCITVKYMSRNKLVTFRDDAKVIRKLDRHVEQEGIDRSDFLRQAIREKLAKEKTAA
jgi:hypothetical protein